MSKLNEENIRVAAYYLWEQAGRPAGSGEEFWAKAYARFAKPAQKAPAQAQKKSLNKPVAAGKPAVKSAGASKPAAAQPFYGIRKK